MNEESTDSTSTFSGFSTKTESMIEMIPVQKIEVTKKGHLGASEMRRIGVYFNDEVDFIRVMMVSKIYKDFVDGYRFNPISKIKLFKTIEEQHLYYINDKLYPKLHHVYRYKVDYSFYLKHREDNCDFRFISYSSPTSRPVTIGYGITHINDQGLYANTVESIDLPPTLISIGISAFEKCDALTSINLCNVIRLSERSFAECKKLKQINIPSTVKIIGKECFKGCTSLSSITLPSQLENIGKACFLGCSGIVNVNVKGRVFKGLVSYHLSRLISRLIIKCKNIEYTVSDRELYGNNIPDGVSLIGDGCFSSISIQHITIPTSVKELGNKAFSKCTQLRKIQINGNSLQILGMGVFMCCYELESIELPNSIDSISESCFVWCRNLQHIKLPEGITSIQKSSFENCKSLVSIELPKSLISIGDHAFSFCDSLEHIVLPEKLQYLYEECFSNCKSLKSINLPSSLLFIGEKSFDGCVVLNEVYWNDSKNFTVKVSLRIAELLWKKGVQCDSVIFTTEDRILHQNKVPNGVTELSKGSFFGSDVEIVSLPSTVKKIGDYCFYQCKQLKKIRCSEKIKIGKNCFGECKSLAVEYF
ncbi:leucine rich repeat protein, BspA family protein [Entamoeba histolytica HM-1:IMSS-B]|uniref:Leucine rich repeat protein, BspA family n=6 Tax=Entamoeba histolytica TaxID=5759 RepID=C4LYP9_ENTH1|nr:uncharacterized protein EHI_004360 [Entamoeba histolytica HM-1:IMSS]EMD47337.1 leucine rich repeatcontaining protein BspA family protein [Entamoeba histolytica KU27]EMH77016.1 leucine rich repeat protein, BspA family protein [Entamoeba histolytica HM-1:IMSS-B]EMS16722.1 leucine rich repeat protein, bspa family protein [Entamoeba histolytica HM-3:IMSS]ENY60918.1 leucine rich repeat protein, bspa family protein [Entamoeba histolytica HM-1:IMSS-A]GAT93957.1 leucine rich repeat protein bspa fam|eukprot:XP_652255.1 uncharacterized protein EHI_004360 [Entamoeba histolytica HM-1:IMSS]